MEPIIVQHDGVTLELIGRTVRAANMMGTLRYFLELDTDLSMPFDERISRGTFAALIAHTLRVDGVETAILDAFTQGRSVRTADDARRAYTAFMDAIDPHVNLYNLWYASVQQARQPVGDVELQPPTDENEDVRKKKKPRKSAANSENALTDG